MSVEVKQTIKFSFPNGSPKPTMGEIANFVKALDADPGQMIATYRIAEERSLFVKFKAEEAMLHCLSHNPEQLSFNYVDGKSVEVRMSPAGGTVEYVRVYDLPPEVPDSDIALVLGRYGDVKRVVREKFPADLDFDMYTGVRGVYIDVKKEIPNSMHFLNRKGNIFYEGNKNVCFLCRAEGHQKNSCPKRKVRKQLEQHQEDNGNRNEENRNNSTYADVMTGCTSLKNHKESEETIEVLEEEVVEMDVTSPENTPNSEEATDGKKQKPPVFKNRSDAYYYYKFGIVDYTEKERIKAEEEAKRLALWQENRLREERELRARKKAEKKLSSPPRKNRKDS